MSETVRRSLVLGARRPLTARAAAILALLAAVGALACAAPTSPQELSAHQPKRYSVSSTGTTVDTQSNPPDTTSRAGSGNQTNSIMPWF
jgi:uncharacterized membrane protein